MNSFILYMYNIIEGVHTQRGIVNQAEKIRKICVNQK